MNIVVCYKIVPDEEGIAIKADRSVDVSGAQWSLGEYDLEALEAAVQLRDSVGGKVTVLTVGGDEVLNSKLKKSILSRGADDQIVVCSEAFANLDAYCTAEVLARALGSTEYDLVLCGEGSSDKLPSLFTMEKVNYPARIPNLKGKLAAKKAVITTITADDIPGLDRGRIGDPGSPTKVPRMFPPVMPEPGIIIDEGSVEASVAKLMQLIKD